MDYKNINEIVEKYYLNDLIAFCFYESSVFMQGLENKPDVDTHWPWVLDAFACFSIRYGKETAAQCDYDEKVFKEICKTIRDHVPDFFKKISFLSAIEQFYVTDYDLKEVL